MKKILKDPRILIFIILLFLVLGIGYFLNSNRVIETELPIIEDEIQNNEDISKYVTKIFINKDEDSVKKLDGYKLINYVISGNVNSEFESLDDNEKHEVLINIIHTLDTKRLLFGSEFNCGKKNICGFSELILFGEKNNHTTAYSINDLSINSDYTMEITYDENGKYNPRTISYKSSVIPTNSSSNGQSTTTTAPIQPLIIEETSCTKDGDYMYAEGFVKNNSNQTYSFIVVNVNYSDENGSIVDTDWTYVVGSEGLPPSSRKSYKVMTPYNSNINKCSYLITDFK